MLGVTDNVCGRTDFDQFAAVENGQPVGDLVGDAQIVGDHQDRAAEVVAQLAQQVQQLCLYGHVERGGGFVGDDQRGPAGHRDGGHHPLPQPAGELVRVHPQAQLGVTDPDGVEQPHGFGVVVGAFADLSADPHRGIQRCHRVLEDRAEQFAAHPPQLGLLRAQHVHPADGDGTVVLRVGGLG